MLLLTISSISSSAASPSFLAFGDSWAYLGYDQFKDVMNQYGFDTNLQAIPGTPAAYWADVQPRALINAIDEHNATHVYLSLGGNDFLEGLPLGADVETLYKEMMASMTKILDRVTSERPDVHLYHFGYEILNWEGSSYCEGFGDMELKGPAPKCPDTKNVSCMTHVQATYLQEKFVDALAQQYRLTKYHGLNLLGTLQVAGGVPSAQVGAPNWDHYSPARFVRSEASLAWGCVHLTPDGFTALYSELAKHLDAEVVPATKNTRASPDPVAVATAERRPCISDPRRQCLVLSPREVKA